MSAAATPTKFDTKPLAAANSLSTTAHTTLYTAPASERGTIVTVVVVNKTTSPVTFTMEYKDVNNTFGGGANVYYLLAYLANIPPDGMPVIFENITCLINSAILTGQAGTATALDVVVYGSEMAA